MKLFAIYIGGDMPGANIELHDMRFVVAESIDETHHELRRQWWGRPESLHIDCWAEIDHADGFSVALKPQPFLGRERLYYVNLGGYDQIDFAEKHKNMFVVATSVADAKSRALVTVKDWQDPHRDEFYEAEQAFSLCESVGNQRLYVHLKAELVSKSLNFICKYTPIKVDDIRLSRSSL